MKHVLLFLLTVGAVYAAGTGKIAGTVVDENGDAMLGANVMVVELQRGVTVLDPNGNFEIFYVRSGAYSVRISCVGYVPELIGDIEVIAGGTVHVNVVLHEEVLQISSDSLINVRFYVPLRLDERADVKRLVRLDEANRVRRITHKELERLPGW